MVSFALDGRDVVVADNGASLLEALRDSLGARSVKDGCSPQGQCGCCTVLVDGEARVACVTPVRRVAGRSVTTLAGLEPVTRAHWANAFTAAGASQCGFCTPGIIMRLAALDAPLTKERVESALLAHLCRCTGWRSIVDACLEPSFGERGAGAASIRATIEGGTHQAVGSDVACGEGGFADDTAPDHALVAVPDGAGGWAVGESVSEARALSGKVQGRRTTQPLRWPLSVPPGAWDLTLRTTWVEPAYLEPDAAWCAPGQDPVGPLANGGAFGGKVDSPVAAAARSLASRYGRAVRVLYAREDVVRLGPKRPPIGAGIRDDGSGVIWAARTPGFAAAVASVSPSLRVEEFAVVGPPTSLALRGAGWVEAAVLLAAVRRVAVVVSPGGAWASASVGPLGVAVRVGAGAPLDEVVLRSYCVGAAHQAIGWVTSEGIAVDDDGTPLDLTIRSFGILRARDMPAVHVELASPGEAAPGADGPGPVEPVNGSDAVFAAVAAAVWISEGLPPAWPTDPRRHP